MTEEKLILSDKELTIMNEIIVNQNVTQRELSKKLGISVSTVNVLINKMIKEGYIKMTQVSQRQVFYMLTPGGMMEKAKKTVRYLKFHYRAIYEMKEKIKVLLGQLSDGHDGIFVLTNDDEMGEILSIAIDEYLTTTNLKKKIIINSTISCEEELISLKSPIVLHMMIDEAVLERYRSIKGLKVVDLTHLL